MERRAWKKNNFERMEDQRTSTGKLGHSQKWMKNTRQLDMNEGIMNGCHEAILNIF
jgi:hypothetical protein